MDNGPRVRVRDICSTPHLPRFRPRFRLLSGSTEQKSGLIAAWWERVADGAEDKDWDKVGRCRTW